jgi:tetratricopeptide (TPR) repeat protein
MDQLVVLQEIYASFSKGGDGLQEIDSKAIEGCCPELIGKLLEGSKKSRIDEDICRKLSGSLQDIYEIKRLGDICRMAGMHSLAISSYNRALSLCRDQILRPVLQNNLGQAYARQGDLARAAFYYQKSASSFAKAGDSTGLAHVLGNLGSAYRRNGDWERAIEHCYRSLKTFEEKSDDLGIAQMTGSLGRIYADMGERELAARYFERSLTDFQRLGDKRSAAWVLDRMGRIAGETMDWDKAQSYFNKSLSLFEQQGQSQGQGIVLSNLGRMYLEMGEATAARESLEKAILLIRRNMQPNYSNALSCLAATYGTLARNCLNEAEAIEELGRGSSQSQRLEASRFFARSSDRFLELASILPHAQPEIKVAAGIARSRSYLAKLSGDVSDEEAVALAERAIASLETAAANATDSKKTKIQGLQKTIAGMKEARSIKLLGSEPWRLIKAVANASELLLNGAEECSSGDINSCLCTGLCNFYASVEAERSRTDPAEKLYAAASDFRSAGKHFMAAEKDPKGRYSRRLSLAAGILEGQASKDNGPIQDDLRNNQLSFGPERDALLVIAEVMADNLLEEIDDGSAIFTWDEALNLMPETGKLIGAEKIKIDELEVEPNPEPISETDLPNLEISPERSVARGLILADGTLEASEVHVLEIINPEEGWLVPVSASVPCRSYGQVILSPRNQQLRGESRAPIEPVMEIIGRDEGLIEELIEAPSRELGYRGNSNEPQEAKLEGVGTVSREAIPDPEDASSEAQEGLFSRAKAILLLKALTVMVVLLLAIETILYLI